MTDGLAGVLLCGGRSLRMGRDKALLEVAGEPLILRGARLLDRIAAPVFLATGTPGRLGDLGYPEVADPVPNAGPLAGIVAGLRASPHPLVAVLAVDLPLASRGVLRLLAEVHGGEDAVVPTTAEGPQPLHAVYSVSALEPMAGALLEGRLALMEVLGTLRIRWVAEDEWSRADPSGRFAVNVNHWQDLALLQREGGPSRGGLSSAS